MVPADVGPVAALEKTTLTPWSELMLNSELSFAGGICLVAVTDTCQVVGWCCGRGVIPEAELLKISVLWSERQKGIGSLLFCRLTKELFARGYRVLFLEVRAGNEVALKFYCHHRFQQVGLRKRYYIEPLEDALLLKKDLAADKE